MVVLPVAILKPKTINIALMVMVCIASFEAIGEFKGKSCISHVCSVYLEWMKMWTIPASKQQSMYIAPSSTQSVVSGRHHLYTGGVSMPRGG